MSWVQWFLWRWRVVIKLTLEFLMSQSSFFSILKRSSAKQSKQGILVDCMWSLCAISAFLTNNPYRALAWSARTDYSPLRGVSGSEFSTLMNVNENKSGDEQSRHDSCNENVFNWVSHRFFPFMLAMAQDASFRASANYASKWNINLD